MKKVYFIILALALTFATATQAQEKTIRGKVTSAINQQVLAGVTVQALGSQSGTSTNALGEFSLLINDTTSVIRFEFIGFTPQTLTLSNRDFLDVSLSPLTQQLSEVVVTAFGIERQRAELSYSTQEVKSEDITRTRDPNFTNALTGKVAGLEVKQSGTMGGSTNIVLRGYKSLTGNNQALFVIDGTPISNTNTNTDNQNAGRGGYDYGNSAADINPDDIESINVLKGAAATALYGARAANGVIMITTKKGKLNSSNITLNTGVTFGTIDRSTFPTYQQEYGAGYANEYSAFNYPSADGNFWFDTVFGNTSPGIIVPFTEDASYGGRFNPATSVYQWYAFDPSDPRYGTQTPWVAAQNTPVTFFKTAVNSNHSISIDGGSDKTTFKIGYARNDETGILENASITKNQFNFAGSHQHHPNLTISTLANFSKIDGLGRYGTGYDGRNTNQSFRQWWQTNVDILDLKEAYDRTGNNVTWNWTDINATGPIYMNNPYWERYNNYSNDSRYRYFGNVVLNWRPLSWLSVLGRASFDGTTEFQEERLAIGGSSLASYSRFDRTASEANYDLLVNFSKDLSKNIAFQGLIGSNLRRMHLNSIRAETNGGLIYENLFSLNNSVNSINAPLERNETIAVDGIFANANFGFYKSLFLEASIRRDQSTTLPLAQPYLYPSIATSFIFSNYIPQWEWLNYGKIRLNYAAVGNDAEALRVQNIYTINPLFDGVPISTTPNDLNNANLRPERTINYEAGLELHLFKNSVHLDVSVYRSLTNDQIMPVDVSKSSGYLRKYVNAGSVSNQGLEVTALVTPIRNTHFNWDLQLNFSTYKSRVVDLYENNENLQLATMQGGITLNATKGQAFGTLRGVDYVYLNGQPVVGEDGYYLSSEPNQVLGSIIPDWTAGIQNTFRYKQVALSFLVDIKKGGSLFSLDQYYGMATGLYVETAGNNELGNPQRLPVAEGGGVILPGVQADGSTNTVRAEAFDNSFTPYGYSRSPQAAFIYDASYVKLRELTINYTFPARLFQSSSYIKGLNIALVGRNLWIIHKNLPYADPELGLSAGNIQGYQSGVYPTVRNYGFNVRVNF
ncbi:SusC/RagA family TonB-linked outer membrane protein [Sphingobacteriaceae bacterium WQ 2009]|uniref:SusC/RagA family TonB-linked outer membrane protein n=1 Tax=Rhinopithecimicrobium faecis TaxID=2820698 RepID=A0A8T4H8B5_9SPHI|nr:SusC/RagA family TonB-linked outer membrane protein [Sphingobacteriaceae bacterium WQ 2009]